MAGFHEDFEDFDCEGELSEEEWEAALAECEENILAIELAELEEMARFSGTFFRVPMFVGQGEDDA